MGVVIDARERFAERRKLADAARKEPLISVDTGPPDKHQLALRELLGEIDNDDSTRT